MTGAAGAERAVEVGGPDQRVCLIAVEGINLSTGRMTELFLKRYGLERERDYDIVATYGAEYRGIVQYYLLAGNIQHLSRLRWVMSTSKMSGSPSPSRSSSHASPRLSPSARDQFARSRITTAPARHPASAPDSQLERT